jgi:hypothetical protein
VIDPRSLIGNALWKGAKSAVEGIWPLVKGPGQILEGSLTPSMEPGPNQLAVPEYALGLLNTAMGARGLGFKAPEGALTHFPVYHGSSARPFREFDDAYLGTGEGTAYEGPGHYTAEREGIAESYRNVAGSGGQIPVDEKGMPLSGYEVTKKFYEPGTIVPSYGRTFDRVEKFNEMDPGTGRWSVNVRSVKPNEAAIEERYGLYPGQIKDMGRLPNDVLQDSSLYKDSSLWTDTGGTRNHATAPSDYEVDSVAGMHNWKMGEPGGLLHINVVPEKHEYLDMNAPWKDQHPVVKERLEKAGMAPEHIDPDHYDISRDSYIPAKPDGTLDNVNYMTGRDLFWSHVNQRADELHRAASMEESIPNWYRSDNYTDQAAEQIAQEMDKAGVPGRKFLDRPSRGVGPVLSHEGNFNGMPGSPWLDHLMREELPPGTFNVDHAISQKARYLRNTTMLTDPGLIKTANDAADWLEREHAAGRFSLDDNKRTRNFITTNPKNLQIRTWNGVPLEPVPHDPFTHSLTPVEGDPFGGQVP